MEKKKDCVFKSCPTCRHRWRDRDSFLGDPRVELVGYQANFGDLVEGFFLFNHGTKDCGTSLAVDVKSFKDMHAGPVFGDRLTGTDECPGYCLNKCSLEPCSNKCECAFVRDVLQTVRKWPKKGG